MRVQGRCRKPYAINGSIEFFFNGDGTFLRFEVEDPKSFGKGRKGGPPGPGKPDDKDGKYDKDRINFLRVTSIGKEMESLIELVRLIRKAQAMMDLWRKVLRNATRNSPKTQS